MANHRLAAIILAAGYSSRMGRFKPLLPIGDKTVIQHTIDIFESIGTENIQVVTGHRTREIGEEILSFGGRVVENTQYAEGMFSSVRTGIRCLDPQSIDAFFITPADICLTRPLTIQLLADAYEENPECIIHPCLVSKRGHPPLIPTSLIPSILKSDANGGLKTILEAHDHSAIEVQVPDRHMLMDMNHMEDYRNAVLRYNSHDIPTEAECEIILKHVCKVPEAIVRHSRKVAQIARQICRALREAGCGLDPGLVTAGALLHDVAKGQENHAAVGARLLSEMGFARIAQIVSMHTDLKPTTGHTATVAEIVYMADKLVMQTRVTTLEARFNQALARYGQDPEAETAILKRKAVALALKEKLERTAGLPIQTMIALAKTDRESGHEVLS